MKKNKRPAAKGSTRQPNPLKEFGAALTQGISVKPRKVVKTTVNTHIATQADSIEIDGFAQYLMKFTFPIWMPESLQNSLVESLRGYDKQAALWIAESLLDCYSGHALATTGIKHIDDMLWRLYSEILNCAREHGIRIANHI